MSRFRSHLKANAVGYVALVVAVIGVPTAWAALGKNTVGSKQLKAKAVTRAKIAPNAINSSRVAGGSLEASDFASGQLPAGPEGQRGAQGPPGPAGTPFRAIAWVAYASGTTPVIEPTEIVPHGFSGVERIATGIFCLTPTEVDPETDPPIITLEYNASASENFTVMWDRLTGECPDDTYEVKTYKAETGDPVDQVSFVIMVP